MNLKQLFSFIAISGAVLNASHVSAQLKVGANPATINTNTSLEAESTDGTRLRVNADNGNVGVGTTAAPTNKLHVGGTDPLRLEGLQATPSPSSTFLVVDANGVVKTQAPTAVAGSTIVVASMSALTLASGGATAGGAIIAVPYDLPELNIGGVWNPSTFEFTAPVDGFYEFAASVILYEATSGDAITRIGVSKPDAAKPGGNDALAAVTIMNFPKGGNVPTVVKVIGINKMLAGQKAFIQGRYYYGTFGAAGAISYDTAANNKLQIKYLGQ